VKTTRHVLPEEVIERLNECMRPSDDMRQQKLAIVLALLHEIDALVHKDLQLTALVHIFDAYPFAYFSGPQTPTDAFPKLPAMGSRKDRAFRKALDNADRRAFTIAVAKLASGMASGRHPAMPSTKVARRT